MCLVPLGGVAILKEPAAAREATSWDPLWYRATAILWAALRHASACSAQQGSAGTTATTTPMAEAIPTVIVIDDDPAIRESVGSLLRSVGLQAMLLASVNEFLKAGRPDGPTCLVLDVRLP